MRFPMLACRHAGYVLCVCNRVLILLVKCRPLQLPLQLRLQTFLWDASSDGLKENAFDCAECEVISKTDGSSP